MGDKIMAKELSLEELEKELQREESKVKKLVELSLSMGIVSASGTTMTFETPGGVYCIVADVVAEGEKKEEEKSL